MTNGLQRKPQVSIHVKCSIVSLTDTDSTDTDRVFFSVPKEKEKKKKTTRKSECSVASSIMFALFSCCPMDSNWSEIFKAFSEEREGENRGLQLLRSLYAL